MHITARTKNRRSTPTPAAWLWFSAADISSSLTQKGETQEVYAKPGEYRWLPAFPAFKHRVEHLGNTRLQPRYIGIKSKARNTRDTPNTVQPPMDAENEKLMREDILAATKRQ